MAKFDLDSYETVESRLARFWTEHPNGRVLTDLVFHDERRFIVKAEIYFDREDLTPISSGFAEEIVGASPVNRVSALENGETSAIGRALANCNYASQGKRPSREEMQKVERYNSEPRKPAPSKAPEKPKEATREEIESVRSLLSKIETIKSLDDLHKIWLDNTDLREISVENTTLKDAILAKKAQIENA